MIDILLHGIPGRTNQGYLSQASAAMVDENVVVDVGSLARRPLLEKTLDSAGIDPGDIEHVLLTHVHYDHCDNVDLFPNATLHVYEKEFERVENGELDWATPRNAPGMFETNEIELFDVGDDVAGLEAVTASGHTEHHVAFVHEGPDLTCGFTGDAVKNVREVATMNPMVLYDKDAAVETIQRLCERVDFVVPGHDTPFYVDEGPVPVPMMDVDFGVNLQISTETATSTTISTNRSELRPMPEHVRDISERQQYH